MIVAVAVTAIVAIAIAFVVAVGRDPGPAPVDVAIGYACALGTGDFDAVYRMLDPELVAGRNRADWIAAARGRPRAAWAQDAVRAVATPRVDGDTAMVDLDVGAGQQLSVGLVRRQRIWTVATIDGVAAFVAAE